MYEAFHCIALFCEGFPRCRMSLTPCSRRAGETASTRPKFFIVMFFQVVGAVVNMHDVKRASIMRSVIVVCGPIRNFRVSNLIEWKAMLLERPRKRLIGFQSVGGEQDLCGSFRFSRSQLLPRHTFTPLNLQYSCKFLRGQVALGNTVFWTGH